MPYERIKTLLARFGDDYAQAYASAIANTEKVPDNVNVILAGALKTTAEQDYHNANMFIGDAIDFCYQVSTMAIWDKIKKANKAIKAERGPIPKTMFARYKLMKSAVNKLGNRDFSKSSAKAVYEECNKLYDDMLAEFSITEYNVTNIIGERKWSWIKGLVIGPPSAVFAGMLIDAYFVEIRKFIINVMG